MRWPFRIAILIVVLGFALQSGIRLYQKTAIWEWKLPEMKSRDSRLRQIILQTESGESFETGIFVEDTADRRLFDPDKNQNKEPWRLRLSNWRRIFPHLSPVAQGSFLASIGREDEARAVLLESWLDERTLDMQLMEVGVCLSQMEDSDVTRDAIIAYFEKGPPFPPYYWTREALYLLYAKDEAVLESSLPHLTDPSSFHNSGTSSDLLRILGLRFPDRVLAHLIETLGAAEEVHRHGAMAALVGLARCDAKTAGLLTDACAHLNPLIAETAAEALKKVLLREEGELQRSTDLQPQAARGQLPTREEVTALVAQIRGTTDINAMQQMVRKIGQGDFAGPTVLELLIDLLDWPHHGVRQDARLALCNLGKHAVVSDVQLLRMMGRPESRYRRAALALLCGRAPISPQLLSTLRVHSRNLSNPWLRAEAGFARMMLEARRRYQVRWNEEISRMEAREKLGDRLVQDGDLINAVRSYRGAMALRGYVELPLPLYYHMSRVYGNTYDWGHDATVVNTRLESKIARVQKQRIEAQSGEL